MGKIVGAAVVCHQPGIMAPKSFRENMGGGVDTSPPESFTITVTPDNDSPTALALSNSSVAENQPAGTAVGTFTTTDLDAGDNEGTANTRLGARGGIVCGHLGASFGRGEATGVVRSMVLTPKSLAKPSSASSSTESFSW